MGFFSRLFAAIARLFSKAPAKPEPIHVPEPQDSQPPKVVQPDLPRVSMNARQLQAWDLWVGAQITRPAEVKAMTDRILANRARYEAASVQINVPWYVLAAIHMRESSLRFDRNMANGQRLDQVTTIVPVGLGPYKTWEESAVDIFTRKGWNKGFTWHLASALENLELYNGLGYRRNTRLLPGDNRPINSPYVWAGTNRYTVGKFVADGKYDPKHVDAQLGAAAIFLDLKARGINLDERYPLLGSSLS